MFQCICFKKLRPDMEGGLLQPYHINSLTRSVPEVLQGGRDVGNTPSPKRIAGGGSDDDE